MKPILQRISEKSLRLADRLVPASAYIHLNAAHHWSFGESELRLLKWLCDRDRVSIDVGAAGGIYTYFLRKFSLDCVAFEPNKASAALLKGVFPQTRIETCALSDHHGSAVLTVPIISGVKCTGYGTIEPSNTFQSLDTHANVEENVVVTSLDSYGLDNVGFIKIDVEGHELSVLRGAKDTIQKFRPRLFVESENRHRPGVVDSLFGLMRDWGYEGVFLDNCALQNIDRFDAELHQVKPELGLEPEARADGPYVNNFMFLPNGEEFQKFTALIC